MSEGFNSAYRENLAKKISGTPKEERKEVLEEAKQAEEYQQARHEHISENQDEESIDDGLGILLKRKTLYHGSPVKGIDTFKPAEEDTVGVGLYLTSKPGDAIGYARGRTEQRKTESPVLYESGVENLKVLDLRKDENFKKILPGFKERLEAELQKPDIGWAKEGALQAAIEKINTGIIGSGNIREITWSHGDLWTEYVKSLGYDGLVTLEGGEGDYVGNHDTYLVFDPEHVSIRKEQEVSDS